MTAKNSMNTLQVPRSIGVILDGNRRWAKERMLPPLAGHKAGYDKVKEVLAWAVEAGITFVTLYVFSTENWNRPENEVQYLLGLIRLLERDVKEFKQKGYRLHIIGDRTRLPHDIQELIARVEDETSLGTALAVACALSYGGQDEIVAAVNQLLVDKDRVAGPVTKEELRTYMWSKNIPFPDLIVRTGGDHRLSNFLTWQSAYSELFFVEELWPAFSRASFDKVLNDFATRNRRFGK